MRPASTQILALYTIQITYLLVLNLLMLNAEMKIRGHILETSWENLRKTSHLRTIFDNTWKTLTRHNFSLYTYYYTI